MQRREFLHLSTGLVLIGSSLAACATEDETDDSGTDDTGDVICTITDATGDSDTHGHSIAIPQADIDNPTDSTYGSTGGTHDHVVNLTAAELVTLSEDCTVTVSSNDTHPHTWIIEMV